jgi:ATP-dependent DNA ligase
LEFEEEKTDSLILISDKVPDMYVKNVKKSLILEVKGSEIIKSENSIGFTLRFPRLIKIRNDKCYKDCMKVEEI